MKFDTLNLLGYAKLYSNTLTEAGRRYLTVNNYNAVTSPQLNFVTINPNSPQALCAMMTGVSSIECMALYNIYSNANGS